jgi:hypothetical protein
LKQLRRAKNNESKGMGIAGIVLNACAIVLIIIWVICLGSEIATVQ